jgi:hypothetical protein
MKLAINFNELNNQTGNRFGASSTNLGAIITAIVPYLFAAAGIILLLYLLAGGFGYLTSAGDPKKAQEAKAKITNALIGFLIVFASYWIVQIAARVLGIQVIQQTFQ